MGINDKIKKNDIREMDYYTFIKKRQNKKAQRAFCKVDYSVFNNGFYCAAYYGRIFLQNEQRAGEQSEKL